MLGSRSHPLPACLLAAVVLLTASAGDPALARAATLAQDAEETTAIGWVEAFNQGVEAMAAFRAEHVVTEQPNWREMFENLRAEWGALEVYGLMAPEPGTFIVGVMAENAGRLRLRFSFDAAARITGMRVEEGDGNSLPPLELSDDTSLHEAEIDEYLQQLADDGVLSGSVLLARDGEVWFERAYGLASREFNVPNTLATRFDVGSFNKDYTRLAIMQLLENDRLALTDKVGEYLPDYPNNRVRDEVTIEQLLEHRSGLGDYFTREYFETPMGSLREIDDYIPIWGPLPLESEPGARESYSNYGYTVLGAIVESITGTSYPEYVEEHIFKPAGMHDTGFFETDGVEPNVAVGYTYMNGMGDMTDTLRTNIYLEPAKGGPWGKSYSTARDLFRFFDSLFDGKLIGDELNWLGDGWNGGVGLAGGGPGLSAILFIEAGEAVIVLANQDEPGAEQVAVRLIRAFR